MSAMSAEYQRNYRLVRKKLLEAAQSAPLKTQRLEYRCACGCGQPHRNNVSRVVEESSSFGTARHVLWYVTAEHKNKHMGLRNG